MTRIGSVGIHRVLVSTFVQRMGFSVTVSLYLLGNLYGGFNEKTCSITKSTSIVSDTTVFDRMVVSSMTSPVSTSIKVGSTVPLVMMSCRTRWMFAKS